MRTLIAVVVLVVVFALIGWLRFGTTNDNPAVEIDTDKVRDDTSAVIEKSKQAIGGAADKMKEGTEEEPAEDEREEVEPVEP